MLKVSLGKETKLGNRSLIIIRSSDFGTNEIRRGRTILHRSRRNGEQNTPPHEFRSQTIRHRGRGSLGKSTVRRAHLPSQ